MKKLSTISWTIVRLVVATLLLSIFDRGPVLAQDSAADEYEIRAAMLFNLTKFVEWPAWKVSDAATPFEICSLGSDELVPAIERLLRNKVIETRPVTTHRLIKTQDGTSCRILYVGGSERKRFEELAPGLAKAAVLTVSDQEWFTKDGGIVGLPLTDNRILIEINLGAAQKSGLIVSSKLLRLAAVVR